MRLPRLRFTVRMLMVLVAIVALAVFLDENYRRTHGIPLNGKSGRFLVFVKTFKGPSAASKAGELAYEYRYHHGLPSYVFVVSELRRSKFLAKQRSASAGPALEEVVVLIGDCKTLAESKAILKQVKQIKSNTIATLAGTLKPLRTVNPYLPASVTTK